MSSIFQYNSSEDLLIYQQRWCPFLVNVFFNLTIEIMEEIHCMEQFFIKLQTIYAFICQICFFILCNGLFNSDHAIAINDKQQVINTDDRNVIVALTTILFYNVFGYFVSRLKEIWLRNRISLFQGVPSFSNYVKWMCKIFLEWVKAIIVVLCLREHGINYQPKLTYNITTFTYYLCTEKIFLEVLPSLLEALNLDCLDNLEHLYVPLVMNIYAILSGLAIGIYTLIIDYSTFAAFTMYFLIYLRIKDVYFNQWKPLMAEKKVYKTFRVATRQDIENWADICAVCLSAMSRARITPCNHFFHPHCLKQCLRSSFYCPLCKQHFMQNQNDTK